MNEPFAFGIFDAGIDGAEGVLAICGIIAVPFSDATMFATVTDAAVAAALLDVGAEAAAASARTCGPISESPIADVRCVF